MDASVFDGLTQLLERSPSRRTAVRFLAGLLTIGPWRRVSDAPGALARRKKRKKTKCKGGKKKCGKKCVDLQTDARNCGSCGNKCGNGEICATGFCLTLCENPSATVPLTSCPVDPGGICVTVDGIAVCVLNDDPSCSPFARESCDGEPCPDGRICASLVCGASDFMCVLPAQAID